MKRVSVPCHAAITPASVLAMIIAAVLGSTIVTGQARHYSLDSADGLRLLNVTATPAALQGQKGLRLTFSEEAMRQLERTPPAQRTEPEQLALIAGLEFSNGVIEAEIAGTPAPGTFEGARGFVGIAFRVQENIRTYDAFYLRPTNGRADDQERRNHSAQYISHPEWTWFRLRKETPARYEAYVDLEPDIWTKVKIDVRGERARLYVHDQEQPTLIVNDLKTGPQGKGGVALWLGPGTIAHFRNLVVTP